MNSKDHVTGNKFKGYMKMGSNIIKKLVLGLLHWLNSFCLLACNGAENCGQGGVSSLGIVKYSAHNVLNMFDSSG